MSTVSHDTLRCRSTAVENRCLNDNYNKFFSKPIVFELPSEHGHRLFQGGGGGSSSRHRRPNLSITQNGAV